MPSILSEKQDASSVDAFQLRARLRINVERGLACPLLYDFKRDVQKTPRTVSELEELLELSRRGARRMHRQWKLPSYYRREYDDLTHFIEDCLDGDVQVTIVD